MNSEERCRNSPENMIQGEYLREEKLPWLQRVWYYYRKTLRLMFVCSGRTSQEECACAFQGIAAVNMAVYFLLRAAVWYWPEYTIVIMMSACVLLPFPLLVMIQYFSLCWRRFHDWNLPGGWVLVPVSAACIGSIEPMAWVMGMEVQRVVIRHPSLSFHLLAWESITVVMLFAWVPAVLALLPGRRGTNKYGSSVRAGEADDEPCQAGGRPAE